VVDCVRSLETPGGGRLTESLANSHTTRTPGAVLWRKTLSQVPTVFGRLTLLASLRNPSTGRYSHEELLPFLGPEDTDRALCNSHHQVFTEWLRFSLAEQKADLDDYLCITGRSRRAVDYRHLIPPTARDVERQLYLTDLETLLELLKYEHGDAFSIPGA
jgi:hypothetical protein